MAPDTAATEAIDPLDPTGYYRWWTEVEIHAPMTLEACRFCGALVDGYDGMGLHRKRHEERGERP